MSLYTKSSVFAFSLVEVLLVLAILAFFAKQTWNSSLASLFTQTDYEALIQAQKNLAQGIHFARQFAVQSQQKISLCGGDYQQALCDGQWSLGWYIQSVSVIKTHHNFPLGLTVRWSGFPANKKQIDFYESGHSGYQNGTFYLCQFGLIAKIVLNQSGRSYLGAVESQTLTGEACL